jgi:hypothetical protein
MAKGVWNQQNKPEARAKVDFPSLTLPASAIRPDA